MNKRIFKRLGLLILLLLIVYHFFGSRPAPVPTGKLEVKPQTLTGVSEAPGTPLKQKKEQPLAPPEKERKYGLSVGAFPNFRSADKMLDKFRKQGTEGFIRRTPGKKKGYQVMAGPFSSRREAEVVAISLKNKLHVSPKLETIIIPVSK